MGAENKSPPKQHTRKRSLFEPGQPRAKRKAGNAAAATTTEPNAVAVSMHSTATRQLNNGIASSIASDRQSSAAGSPPAIPSPMVHLCGHCQKRLRSPAKLAQHERVHATANAKDAAIYCSVCLKQCGYESAAIRHERTHTGETPYASRLDACKKLCKVNLAERLHADDSTDTAEGESQALERPVGCDVMADLQNRDPVAIGDLPIRPRSLGRDHRLLNKLPLPAPAREYQWAATGARVPQPTQQQTILELARTFTGPGGTAKMREAGRVIDGHAVAVTGKIWRVINGTVTGFSATTTWEAPKRPRKG